MTEGAFVYRRRVRWADSDAARIAYTGRFIDYAMEAIEEWFRIAAGVDWYQINTQEGYGTAFVHVEMDIHRSLRPGDEILIGISLTKIGRSSLELAPSAHTERGEPIFTGRFVCVVTDMSSHRSMPIPHPVRLRLTAYGEISDE